MLNSRRYAMLAAALMSAGYPAFPMARTSSVVTSAKRFDPYDRDGRLKWPRYPFSSTRQDSRRYISVVGRNGHATMQRIK